MSNAAGKGNFSSKFLNLIGKKKAKPKYGSTGSVGSGDSDEDGYMDPEGLCPTEPPRDALKPPIPDYPPPYFPSSKSPKAPLRPFSSIEYGASQNMQSAQPRDHAKSLEFVSRKQKPAIPEKPKAVTSPRGDDYSDPWDSKGKPVNTPRANQQLAGPNTRGTDNYMDPYDSKKAPNLAGNAKPNRDNYIEPWDSRSKPRDVKKNYRDDYKDPWDSKMPASLPQSSYEEDEDYTVPYDAGKPTPTSKMIGNGTSSAPIQEDIYDMTYEDQLIAAKAKVNAERKTSKDTMPPTQVAPQQKFVQEDNYEEPWEWKAKNYKKEATHPPKPVAAAKVGPGAADDYDAPWEWSNKAFTKAMANLPPPSAEQKEKSRERVDSAINNQNKPTQPSNHLAKSQSAPVSQNDDPKVYEVDPTIPLENQSWYHGKIARFEAESLLTGRPDCSYLIRDSESSKTDYSLSVRNNNEPMHLKISCRQGKFILGQNSRPYDSIPEMIHNYSMNNLNIRGAEKVRLMYPVLQEAMYFTVEPGS